MDDNVDKAADAYEEHRQYSVALAQRIAGKIQLGKPGTCELCDDYFIRVVEVNYRNAMLYACAGCRDQLKIG